MPEVVPINAAHSSSTGTTPGGGRAREAARDDHPDDAGPDPGWVRALSAGTSSARLKAALAAGTSADPRLLDVLLERCAAEPDFFVRDMLTWALTRLPPEVVVPRLRAELTAERGQARSQALHTLSKIGDPGTYPSITRALLHDADDEVARSAWRAAALLVPEGQESALATELAAELGRGGRDVRRSLSRALVGLGDAAEPLLRAAAAGDDPVVAAHARATTTLLRDPEAGFDGAIEDAERIVALGPDRAAELSVAAGEQQAAVAGDLRPVGGRRPAVPDGRGPAAPGPVAAAEHGGSASAGPGPVAGDPVC